MSVKDLYVRAEITVWEILIAIMLQSRAVQSGLCKAHDLLHSQSWVLRLPKPIYWAGAGIGIGFVLGFLGAVMTP